MATMTRSETNTRALSPVLGRYFERTWVRGEGHRLWDDQGKRYLDFGCGIATTGLGHGHPAVTAAIHAQVDRLVARLERPGVRRVGEPPGRAAARRPARRRSTPSSWATPAPRRSRRP